LIINILIKYINISYYIDQIYYLKNKIKITCSIIFKNNNFMIYNTIASNVKKLFFKAVKKHENDLA